jgi:intracellular multiplication protein IcmQ
MHIQNEKILQLVQTALDQDTALRLKYQVGDKFRFIRDRLQAVLASVNKHIEIVKESAEETTHSLAADEMLVYVYLYNANGIILKTWQNMLNPAVFYEYSVNRPIYTEKSDVQAFIRSKTNKVQHAFLTIAIKKQHMLKAINAEEMKDTIGSPLIKVKEGSLLFNRLISFTHNGNDYVLDEMGLLVKSSSND